MSTPRHAVVLLASILSLGLALRAPAQPTSPDLKDDLKHAHSLSRVFNNAAKTIGPSVVHITQIREVMFQRSFFSQAEKRTVPVGAGSGVIVSADGYILTNNHVIENAERVEVLLADGRTLPGKIVGVDPATDLGVVKIEATGLAAAQFGDSDDLVVGDWVLAVGSPFGIFDNTVTAGIVSAKGRTNLTGPADSYQDFIQTDAAVNPGNSGGPLVNLEGKVVGINSQIASRSGGYEGLSFAIPSAIAEPTMQMLVKSGHVSRGWVGITMKPVTPDLAPQTDASGVLVESVSPGGPAEGAGLRTGDLITRFSGRAVSNLNRLRTAIAMTPPGSDIQLEVRRDGKPLTIPVHVANRDDGIAASPGGSALKTYGFTVGDLNPRIARTRRISGVVVATIDGDGPAAQAQLETDDIIAAINDTPVASVEAFDRVMKSMNRPVRLNVIRLKTGASGYLDIVPAR